ncbi:hypothetical protein HF519_14125 [Pseudonocardia bannensis]|uniref:Tetracyclin repressor-like C-terminal domain-containing protein n=1 Tax=Pseudonocardia bannensis TaxID=630973 RepID=A0A848DJH7_9PSEU|nr:hypothetical protein [Pseudonocardia bannensis]
MGKSTVYRWWPSKSALVIEALGTQWDDSPIELTGDSRADIHGIVQAALDGYGRSPLGAAVPGLAVDLMCDPDGAESFEALLQPRRGSLGAILEEAANRGDLPPDTDALLLQDILVGTLLYRLLVSRRPTDGVVEKLVDLFLDGQVPRTVPENQQKV